MPARILVVDDDADIRRIAALALERIGGFQVTLAGDGPEALAQAARELPDLVLLDVSMPGMDGPATLAALRALERDGPRPRRLLHGDVERHRGRAPGRLGAVGVVPKPFEVERSAATRARHPARPRVH